MSQSKFYSFIILASMAGLFSPPALGATLAVPANSPGEVVAAPPPKADPEVLKLLAAYDKDKSLPSLFRAADLAGRGDGSVLADPKQALQRARDRVVTWTAVLSRFRDLKDETPNSANHSASIANLNPATIKDPAARKAYEAQRRTQQAQLTSAAGNQKLRMAHTGILDRAVASVQDARAKLGLSDNELKSLLASASISPQDRSAMLARKTSKRP